MNKKIGAAFLGVAMLVPIIALAAEFRAGEQISFPASQSTKDDLYIAGGSVTSAGSVSGDAVAVGGNVLVSGKIDADLMAAGAASRATSLSAAAPSASKLLSVAR